MDAIGAREQAASAALGRSDYAGALSACLAEPPVASKDAAVKDANGAVVAKVLAGVPDASVQSVIDALDDDAVDVLMKYVHKGLSTVGDGNLALFKWHSKLVESHGLGPIVRAFADRKTV